MRLLIKEIITYGTFAILLIFTPLTAAPTVANLHASQRIDLTKMVDIYFNIIHDRSVTVSIYASQDNGVTWNFPISNITGDVGPNISPGNGKHIVWDVLAEHPNIAYENVKFKVEADDGVIDLTSGLVAYYPFNGNANDESGKGNHGTVSGAILVSDRFGNPFKAYFFDGQNDCIIVPNNSSLNPQLELSISMWYKTVSFTGVGNNALVTKGYPTHTPPYYQYHLGVTGNTYSHNPATFEFYTNGCTIYSPNNYWTPGNWYHLVAVYNQTEERLYVNGNLITVSQSNGTMSDYGSSLYIGKFSNFFAYTPGTIDDVRIYNRTLSDQEISLLFNLGSD